MICHSVAPSLCRSVAPSLCCYVDPSLCRSVALSIFCSVATFLFAPLHFQSIHSSLHNFFFLFSILCFNIQTYPRTGTCGDELDCADSRGPAGRVGGTGTGGREVSWSKSSPRVPCPWMRLGARSGASGSLRPAGPLGLVPPSSYLARRIMLRWPWKRRFH